MYSSLAVCRTLYYEDINTDVRKQLIMLFNNEESRHGNALQKWRQNYCKH